MLRAVNTLTGLICVHFLFYATQETQGSRNRKQQQHHKQTPPTTSTRFTKRQNTASQRVHSVHSINICNTIRRCHAAPRAPI
uniref:Putative secreted protein n=1 Tax=Anopheles marajoara TaxID=58244 RepID=A0A2M4CBX8_9DIPT